MKVSLTWLKEFVDVPWPPDELARQLTRIGLPVDAVETTGPDLTNFVVGLVVEAGRHPNADKLTLCRVDVGRGEPLDIVCGAPNAAAGLRGAVALVGAVLPDGTKIKKAKLRGVESNGMLCSERELGLSDEHTGIIDLGPSAPPPGTPLATALPLGDVLLEIDVPSNRGDCLSHLGIAREIAALTGNPVRRPPVEPAESAEPAGRQASVVVEDAEGCPRYLARIIRGVTIGPSPDWLVRKLTAIGQRPISNVVDTTNHVLWEMGQPLHAFDFDRLAGGRIVVRRARPGERLTTLDGQERALTPEVLIIADRDRAVALAGIMGGADTEVGPGTTNILLEGAVFDPYRVLRGTRVVRLTTEANLRFIRGVDPAGTAAAIDRCARLLAEVAGGQVLQGRVEVVAAGLLEPRRVTCSPGAAERLLGEAVSDDETEALLGRLGFQRVDGGGAAAPAAPEAGRVFEVPSHRSDVRLECDLVEEVARLHGYDRIGERNLNAGGLAAVRPALDEGIDRVRSLFMGLGFHEMLSKALVDPDDFVRSGFDADGLGRDMIRIPEAQSRDESVLRTSLLPGALKAVAHNLRHGRAELRLFEVGTTYHRDPAGPLAVEPVELLAVATGGNFGPDLTRSDPVMDFFRFKGILEAFLAALRVDAVQMRCYDRQGFEEWSSASIEARGRTIGQLGQVSAEIREAWDIPRPVYAAQLDLNGLLAAVVTGTRFEEPSRFPASRRDLAFLLEASIPEARVAALIRRFGGRLLKELTLFDRFAGKPLPPGQVSLAYALTWQSTERTLSDEDVRVAEQRVVEGLKAEVGAVLRDR